MSVIRAVIFDLGNVLISFDHRLAARRIAPFARVSAEEIYALFFDSELIGQFEEGRVSPEQFHAKVSEALGCAISYENFLSIWNEIFFLSEDNRAVLALARHLRESVPVYVLSNINVLHLEYVKKQFAVLQEFDRVFASCELMLRKPDVRIYRGVAERIGVGMNECFYTDDRPELIAAASQLGMQARVFRGIRQLRVDLEALHLPALSKNS